MPDHPGTHPQHLLFISPFSSTTIFSALVFRLVGAKFPSPHSHICLSLFIVRSRNAFVSVFNSRTSDFFLPRSLCKPSAYSHYISLIYRAMAFSCDIKEAAEPENFSASHRSAVPGLTRLGWAEKRNSFSIRHRGSSCSISLTILIYQFFHSTRKSCGENLYSDYFLCLFCSTFHFAAGAD